ncbi:MAG TPA: hypothetical protein VMH37_18975 [Candidatus Binataceae bacterium]|nr:hypothetical protein [Candidatus Binataceae bacterium]
MKRDYRDDYEQAINNPPSSAFRVGFHRLAFRRDAPRWFTLVVFASFVGLIFVALLSKIL